MKVKIEFDIPTKSSLSQLGRKINLRKLIKYVLFLAVITAVLYFRLFTIEWIAAIYLIGVLVFALESSWTFGIALFFLFLVSVLSLLKKDALAENYAVASYYFLVIGVISAILELRRENKEEIDSETTP